MIFLFTLLIEFFQRLPFEGASPIQVNFWQPGSVLMISKVSIGSYSFFVLMDGTSRGKPVQIPVVKSFVGNFWRNF